MEKSKTSKVERDLLDNLVRSNDTHHHNLSSPSPYSHGSFVENILVLRRQHKDKYIAAKIYSQAARDSEKSIGTFASMFRGVYAKVYALLFMPPQISMAIEKVHDSCGLENALEAASIIYSIIGIEKDHTHMVIDISYTLFLIAGKKPQLMEEALYSIGISKNNPGALMVVTGKLREMAREA